MTRALALLAALALAACHPDEIVSPTKCTTITQKGWHADTSVTTCER